MRALALVALFISAAAAYVMYTLAASEQLWGHLPLVLYLSLWAGASLFLLAGKSSEVRRRFLLSTASGVMLGVGFPGYLPFPLLLLVAWVPLLSLQDETRSTRSVFLHGYNAFLLYNILATFWVTNTAFAAGLFAVAVNSLLMTLPWLAFHWTSRVSPRVRYLALIAFWLSFEYGHYNWSLNWPWLTLGNGFAQFPALVQWYEWTGVLGGSAWILLVNVLIFRWTRHLRPRPFPTLPLLATVLPMVVSLLRFSTYTAPPGESITVSAVQPNFEPHFEKFSGGVSEQLGVFLDLSAEAVRDAGGSVDYLLYPETSFSRVDADAPFANPALQTLRERIAGPRYLVTGIQSYQELAPGSPPTDAARYARNADGSSFAYEALNAALQIDLQTAETQLYRKGVFVPGAESFPFRRALFFLEPLVASLGGTTAGLGTQPSRDPLVGERARVAPVICYESVFGDYFTDYIREGAQAIFVMTNDGWWDNTAGHRQHLYFSSLRAIETRRAVVRSANLGACAFIDQRGEIVSRTYYDQRGYLNGELRLNDAVTPYVRFGDLAARIALLLSVMALLSNLAHTLRRKAGALGEDRP
jgi:apolipoprotein N-acyltransferase